MKIQYELFVCDISGEHTPIVRFTADQPFMPVTEDQRFDDHGWQRLNGVGQIATIENPILYTVHSIKHTILQTNDLLLIQYWLNLNPFDGAPSPIWPKT